MPSRESVVARSASALETAEQRAARQVAAAYNQARQELITRLLDGWTATGVLSPDDAARFLRQSGLLQQIDARLQQLEREVGITLRGIVTASSERALDSITRELALLPRSIRGSLDITTFGTINERMVEQFVPVAMSDWRGLTTAMSSNLQRELQTGLIQGEAYPDLVRRLLSQSPGEGAVFPRAQTSAELATRRLVVAAENGAKQQAIAQVAQSIPEIQKQALAAVGKNTTDCCLRAHGQIQPVDQPFELVGEPRFADQLMIPPFHWSCRTGVTMYHPAFEKDMPTDKLKAQAQAELKRRREEKEGRGGRVESGKATSRRAPSVRRASLDDIFSPSVAPSRITPDRPGVILESDGAVAQGHLQDYNRIPVALRDAVEAKGVKVYINNDKTLPDIDRQEAFRGVRPRGWPEGSTWDIVAGAYNSQDRYVIAGKGQSGSVSLLLHEYGHAAGDALGYDNDVRLIALHKSQYDRLDPYHQQGGPGGYVGRQEFLAEAFAHTLVDRATAISRYGQGMIDFVENVVWKAGKVQTE